MAASANGAVLAGALYGGMIYVSTNFGGSWNPSGAPATNWSSIAISADSMRMAAAAGFARRIAAPSAGLVYTSTNQGATWAPTTAPSDLWTTIVGSADGTKLVAASGCENGCGRIVLSTDAGASWSENMAPPVYLSEWYALAGSADARSLVTGGLVLGNHGLEPRPFCISTNFAQTWRMTNLNAGTWLSMAIAADGRRMAGTTDSGLVYTSIDGGVSWTSNAIPYAQWTSISSSADGSRMAVCATEGLIYILSLARAPQLDGTVVGNQVRISWLLPAANFVLQDNGSIGAGSWTDVPGLASLDLTSLRNEVALPITPGARFFRLRPE